jgi:hypothetical protein
MGSVSRAARELMNCTGGAEITTKRLSLGQRTPAAKAMSGFKGA